jgi:hypothetical protein
MVRPFVAAAILAYALMPGVAAASPEGEVVHLVPEDRASWRARNLFGWMRPGHFYGERKLEIESTPPGATLELFYVRSNFQKLYQQAVAPATVILPRRSEAGPRDSVTIRASLPGFRQMETSIRVESKQEEVILDLDPLPNALRGIAHTYFGGRGSLSFLTDESATVRMQERKDGVQLVMAETGMDEDLEGSVAGLTSPLVENVEAIQIGEDLLIRVQLAEVARGGGVDLRSRRAHDAIRDLYSFSLDLVPADGGVAAVERARAALARISARDVGRCRLAFDETLRSELDPGALSRALSPKGAFTDPYLRAAMKRLGEISPGGAVTLLDGSQLRPGVPLELAAATSQGSQVKGYLAVLRAFADQLEPAHPDPVLRSMVAPELDPAQFEVVLEAARRSEQACRSQAAR